MALCKWHLLPLDVNEECTTCIRLRKEKEEYGG